MALAVGKYVGQMLVKRAAECNIENLHTATDCQNWFVEFNCGANHGKLKVIVLCRNAVDRVATRFLPVAAGVDIATTLNNHSVKARDEFMSGGNGLFDWLCLNNYTTGSSYGLAVAATS